MKWAGGISQMSIEELLMTDREYDKLMLLTSMLDEKEHFRLNIYAQMHNLSYATAYNLSQSLKDDVAQLNNHGELTVARYRKYLMQHSVAAEYILYGLFNCNIRPTEFAQKHHMSELTLRRRLNPFRDYLREQNLGWQFTKAAINGNELLVEEMYLYLIEAMDVADVERLVPDLPIANAEMWVQTILGVTNVETQVYALGPFLKALYLLVYRAQTHELPKLAGFGPVNEMERIVIVDYARTRLNFSQMQSEQILNILRYLFFIDSKFWVLSNEMNHERSIRYQKLFSDWAHWSWQPAKSYVQQEAYIFAARNLVKGTSLLTNQSKDDIRMNDVLVRLQPSKASSPKIVESQIESIARYRLKPIQLLVMPDVEGIGPLLSQVLFSELVNVAWYFKGIRQTQEISERTILITGGPMRPQAIVKPFWAQEFEWVGEMNLTSNMNRLVSLILQLMLKPTK